MNPIRRDSWLAHQRAARALATWQTRWPREGWLVVKSVALCARYGWDPAESPIADVDVRLTPASYRRICHALRAEHGELSACPELVQHLPAYQSMVFEFDGQLLDVESHIGPPGLSRLPIADLLARAELVQLPPAEPLLVPELHDHLLVLAVNLFKDGLARASAHAVANALRLVQEPGFSVQIARKRAEHYAMHTQLALVAQALAPRSARWTELARALPDLRALYTKAHALSERAPGSLAARLLRRLASDAPSDRVRAVWAAFRYERWLRSKVQSA